MPTPWIDPVGPGRALGIRGDQLGQDLVVGPVGLPLGGVDRLGVGVGRGLGRYGGGTGRAGGGAGRIHGGAGGRCLARPFGGGRWLRRGARTSRIARPRPGTWHRRRRGLDRTAFDDRTAGRLGDHDRLVGLPASRLAAHVDRGPFEVRRAGAGRLVHCGDAVFLGQPFGMEVLGAQFGARVPESLILGGVALGVGVDVVPLDADVARVVDRDHDRQGRAGVGPLGDGYARIPHLHGGSGQPGRVHDDLQLAAAVRRVRGWLGGAHHVRRTGDPGPRAASYGGDQHQRDREHQHGHAEHHDRPARHPRAEQDHEHGEGAEHRRDQSTHRRDRSAITVRHS